MRLVYAVALIASGILLPACSADRAEQATRPAVPVTVTTALQKDVPVDVRVIGSVEAYSTVAVQAQVSGELNAIHFSEGQDVKKGDLLFSVDPRPFESDLKRAEANLAKNIAGGRQAEANLARDTAQQKHSELEARRYEQLVEQGIVAREEYDRVRTNAEALQAVVRADQAAIENSEQTVRADRAAIENARLQLEHCSIRSPISGRTGSILVHQGNLVRANDTTLIVINQITPVYVSFGVPEQTLAEIKKNMSAGLAVEAAVPSEEGQPVRGMLSFVNNAVDNTTGTIRLKATFANEGRRLWPGQFVHVVMTLTTERDALVVPSQAVQAGQSGTYVFVVKPDGSVESRAVTMSRTFAGDSVIPKGLRPGEKVVLDGHLRLVPGSKVDIKGSQEARQGDRP